MRYATYDDILRPTWTIPTGTERGGYEINHAGDLDPSAPVWIEENQIRAVGDLGSATAIAAVALIAHTFDEDLDVRVQANATNVWTAPAVNEGFTIEAPYRNNFACHALKELSATLRYVSVTNVGDANSVTVAIGEIVVVSAWRTLNPSIGHDYPRPLGHLSASQRSKRGVQTVYDFGSRERALKGRIRVASAAELDVVLDWCDTQHNAVRPMLVVLDENGASRRDREPHLCRFVGSTVTPVSFVHQYGYDVDLEFEEMGCGELVGA